MSVVADRSAKHIAVSPTFLMALLAMLYPVTAHAALPSAPPEVAARNPAATSAGATAQSDSQPDSMWFLPPVRIGGAVSYDLRREMSDEQTSMQQGLTGTLNASTSTYIWQPWFAQANGSLGLTVLRASSGGSPASTSVVVTGNGQLSVLASSRIPFEAHYERNDSRVSSDLSLGNGYASQRYGFTQRYRNLLGEAMVGWDRSTQTSAADGRTRQDSLQMNVAQRLEQHQLRLAGAHNKNTHELSAEQAVQSNLSLHHSYAPGPTISVENMANISRSGYHLQQGDNNTRLMQLSSHGFWRPADRPMTVSGGARVLALEADTTGIAANSDAVRAQVRNANANVGVNYDLSRALRLNAGGNLTMAENNGAKSTSFSQSLGASYQPDSIELGGFRYGWSSSVGASNQTSGEDSARQLTLQLGHNINRSFKLEGGSTVGAEASQSLSVVSSSSSRLSSQEPVPTKRMTHSGSLSWDLSQQAGAAQLRLGASDSRALDGKQEFFQLVNFQASSNLPTSRFSSWTGDLTIQAVRQGSNAIAGDTDPFRQQTGSGSGTGFATTSSGSISYQNQRAFGILRLRFVSDLRLNSQALLPLLGSAKDQETAAWVSRFEYSIGRTQLRLHALISRSSSQRSGFNSATGAANTENVARINKAIAFSITRSFGNY